MQKRKKHEEKTGDECPWGPRIGKWLYLTSSLLRRLYLNRDCDRDCDCEQLELEII